MIRTVLRQLGSLLGEARCPACGGPVASALPLHLCPACAPALVRREGGFCDRCGAIAAWPDLPPAPCGKCLTRVRLADSARPAAGSVTGGLTTSRSTTGPVTGGQPAARSVSGEPLATRSAAHPCPWDHFFLHGAYAGLLRDLLLRFKHKHELSLAAPLGALLAAHPGMQAQGTYDAVIPLPLHSNRLRERGFNQSLELAKPVAKTLAATVQETMLRRIADTVPQTSLHHSERQRNVRGIFAADATVRGQRLLLIDDIATTGATLEEAVKTLLAAGAAGVDVAVVARTPDYSAL